MRHSNYWRLAKGTSRFVGASKTSRYSTHRSYASPRSSSDDGGLFGGVVVVLLILIFLGFTCFGG
jgi:hypothetical protein